MASGSRPIDIVDERVVLDGRTLRLFVRASAPLLRAELTGAAGSRVGMSPLVPVDGGYSASFDLGRLANADRYTAILRAPDDTTQEFGRLIAARYQSLPGLRQASGARPASAAVKVAAASYQNAGAAVHASVYVDRSDLTLRLRLSAVDDIDAFLATHNTRPAASPDIVHFSVVTPVYNVARYLDDYLTSITAQSLDFRRHVELLMVDDGSTDNSAKIIKRWQRKFPDNIRYLHKENGGVASARNLGLRHATHEWVTFCDPDDLLDRDYFRSVEAAMLRNRDTALCAVVCYPILFDEATREYSDEHYLRFKFSDGEKLVPVADLDRAIQFNASSTFLKKSELARFNLTFDESVRPNFEDSHLLNRLFLRSFGSFVLHVPSAKYFYRHRIDRSSLVQQAPRNADWYGRQLRQGYLALLREARELHARVPRFIQNLVMCDLYRQLNAVIDHAENVSFLDDAQRQTFRDLLVEIFALIDDDLIAGFDIRNYPRAYRMGILNLFKGRDPPRQVAEVTDLDASRGLAEVTFWSRNPSSSGRFTIDDVDVEPAFAKLRRRDFLGDVLIWEHIRWLPLPADGFLRAFVDGAAALVDVGGKAASSGVETSAIRTAFRRPPPHPISLSESADTIRGIAQSPGARARFQDAWLFVDRDSVADDNAEHLYRHVRRDHPEINAFYLLRRTSADWPRLEREGFRLVPFGGPEHILALLNASRLISSHADLQIWNYLAGREFRDLLKFKFAFLQHGVTKDDISLWLNGIPIDLMATATMPEFESVVGQGSAYKLSRKEVVLTGFPRFDALAAGPVSDGREIVLMPTWRDGLSSRELADPDPSSVDREFTRAINPAFYTSEFANRWKRLLHSERLAVAAATATCRLVFVPHQHLLPYIDFFAIPDSVEVRSFGGERSIQQLIQRSSVFITDYSSLAFDVAYLEKPVVYYQFDREAFFGGGHMYRRGYFDYDRDGFGPVCTDEEALVDAIAKAAAAGAVADAIFRERAKTTFAFRDGKCCERVFEAILALGKPFVGPRVATTSVPETAA